MGGQITLLAVDKLPRFANIRAEDHEQRQRSRNASTDLIDEVNLVRKLRAPEKKDFHLELYLHPPANNQEESWLAIFDSIKPHAILASQFYPLHLPNIPPPPQKNHLLRTRHQRPAPILIQTTHIPRTAPILNPTRDTIIPTLTQIPILIPALRQRRTLGSVPPFAITEPAFGVQAFARGDGGAVGRDDVARVAAVDRFTCFSRKKERSQQDRSVNSRGNFHLPPLTPPPPQPDNH